MLVENGDAMGLWECWGKESRGLINYSGSYHFVLLGLCLYSPNPNPPTNSPSLGSITNIHSVVRNVPGQYLPHTRELAFPERSLLQQKAVVLFPWPLVG